MQKIKAGDSGYWLSVVDSHIRLIDNELPYGDAQSLVLINQPAILLGIYRGEPLYLLLNTSTKTNDYISLRSQLSRDQQEFQLLTKGVTLHHFWRTHQHCGVCGHTTALLSDTEIVIECPTCHYRVYPTLAPCIIVAVRKDNRLLLAKHIRHKDEKMYTVLAGFVEPGETLEQCVQREVFEETGIHVTNIQYVMSQPWAFPNQLMIGFITEYESGEISIQDNELIAADWFDCTQELPLLPIKGTLSRQLIELTIQQCRKKFGDNTIKK